MNHRSVPWLVLLLILGLLAPWTRVSESQSATAPAPVNWALSIPLAQANGASYGPQLAFDAQGTTYAIWADTSRGWTDVMFASQPRDGAWSQPLRLSDVPGPFSLTEYHLVVEPAGTVDVLWIADHALYATWRTADGAWGAPTRLAGPMAGLGDLQVQVDSQGMLYVVLTTSVGRPTKAISDPTQVPARDIFYITHPAGGAWTKPVNVSHSAWDSVSPVLALEDTTAHVAWLEKKSQTEQQLYYAEQVGSLGGAVSIWSEPLALSNAGTWAQDVYLIMAPKTSVSTDQNPALPGRDLVAVWTEGQNGASNIALVERQPGAAWSTPAYLLPRPGLILGAVPLFTTDGNLHLAWRACSTSKADCADGGLEVYYVTRPAGKSWGRGMKMSSIPPHGITTQLTLVADQQNNVYVAWVQSTSNGRQLLLASRWNNIWNEPQVVGDVASDPGAGRDGLALRVDNEGAIHAAWPQDVGGRLTIFSRVSPLAPFLDLPFDYPGRGTGSIHAFRRAFALRTVSVFDHATPFRRDGQVLPFVGPSLSNSGGEVFCLPDALGCYDGHEGYDFVPAAGSKASTVVLPAAPGMVVAVQTDPGSGPYGEYVDIDHGNGYRTRYGHLSQILTTLGSQVTRTTPLGVMGSTGHATGIHLHLNVYHEDRVVDPSGWFGTSADPWAGQPQGARSDALWLFPLRTERLVDSLAGADVVLDRSAVSAEVAPGTFPGPLRLALTTVPAKPEQPYQTAGYSWLLEATTADGAPVTRFDKSLTLRILLRPDTMPESLLRTASMFRWDVKRARWQPLPYRVDGTILTALVDQPGMLAVIATPK